MTRRLPLLPTLLVLIAVPVMIGFGLWQLERLEWKEALLARLAANASAPLLVLDRAPAEADGFRLARADCTTLTPPAIAGAAPTVDGRDGFRHTARCTLPGGGAVLVSLGVGRDPMQTVAAPATRSFTGRLVPRAGEPAFLLVAERPAAGLVAEAPPGPDSLPNNHLSYAIQWFAFAATLAIVYVVYVRRRRG